jgi:DNA polymerase (family 10)
MASNAEIAAVLRELARLTTLAEGSPQAFRVRAYETAARAVESHDEPVAGMPVEALTGLRGIGSSTAEKITEYLEKGRIGKLEELRGQFPLPFQELTRVPGIGPKTAVLLRDGLGVESVDDLKGAIERRELRDLPGLGAKTEENIARSISRLGLGGKERRTPIAEAMQAAGLVARSLAELSGVERTEVMGSLRRFRDTIGDVDVIVVSDDDPEEIMDRFVSLPVVGEVVAYGTRKSAILSTGGLQIDLRVIRPDQYGSAAMYFTGSKAHNIRLRRLAIDRGWQLNEYGLTDAETGETIASVTEEEVYRALGLDWIPPELREDRGEIELAASGSLPALVGEGDLRGDLHVHTDLSGDGREPLEVMVAAAAARGYEYLAITDHGEDLTINGVSREQMLGQRDRLAELQEDYPAMRLLHGCELNIGPDGSIDYDPEFLAGFDWGVAGVHGWFDLDRDQQTRRVVMAMENPAVNAIGHLTGRMIGRRPGIELDTETVLAAAERTGCALEINSHLDRLDASSEMLYQSRSSGVLTVINTDAHDTRELGNIRWGIANARRGWVERERVANTWPLDRFLDWAAHKRGR